MQSLDGSGGPSRWIVEKLGECGRQQVEGGPEGNAEREGEEEYQYRMMLADDMGNGQDSDGPQTASQQRD